MSSVVPIISTPMMRRPTFSGASSTQHTTFMSRLLLLNTSWQQRAGRIARTYYQRAAAAARALRSFVLRYMR